jgi:hypothetical protein
MSKMNIKLIGALFLGLLAAGTANAGTVVANLEDVTNGGSFFAEVTFEDIDGGVKVTADIADPINAGLTKGDILGLGFHILNEGLLLNLTIDNNGRENPTDIITDVCQLANACDVFNGGSGSPGNGFDIVVSLGATGSADGFNQTVMFEMFGTSAIEFANQSVGMRVQSIEGADFFAGGSSKLIGDGPGPDPDPDPDPVPVPGSLLLLGLGLFGLRFARKSAI